MNWTGGGICALLAYNYFAQRAASGRLALGAGL